MTIKARKNFQPVWSAKKCSPCSPNDKIFALFAQRKNIHPARPRCLNQLLQTIKFYELKLQKSSFRSFLKKNCSSLFIQNHLLFIQRSLYQFDLKILIAFLSFVFSNYPFLTGNVQTLILWHNLLKYFSLCFHQFFKSIMIHLICLF